MTRLRWAVGTLVAALVYGCVFPSDHSADLLLSLDNIPLLAVGDTFRLTVRPADSVVGRQISARDIIYTTSNPTVAVVTDDGRLIALASGQAVITARARQADAPAASRIVSVGGAFSVDSLSPDTVRFGDSLRIFGAGLNPARTVVSVGGVVALPIGFVPAIAVSPNGYGTLTVYVPVPALSTARVVAHGGSRGEASSSGTITVIQRDRLEPNDSAPADIGTLRDSIVLRALALEASAAPAPLPRDWYTFTNPVGQGVTLILKSPVPFLPDALSLAFTDRLAADGSPLPQGWVIAPGANYCRGTVVPGYTALGDSLIIALKGLAAGTYHVQVNTRSRPLTPRPYELRIVTGYRSVLPPDASEPHDDCASAADVGALSYQSGQAFNPPGRLENPGAVDWFRFSVADSTGDWIFLAGTTIGTPNGLVLEILTASGQFVGGGFDGRANLKSLTVCLRPGQYLLAASDVIGEPVSRFGGYAWLGARACP